MRIMYSSVNHELALLSVEKQMLNEINYDNLINNFALKKLKK